MRMHSIGFIDLYFSLDESHECWIQEPTLDSTIDDNESVDIEFDEKPEPKDDVDLLKDYENHEWIGGSGKYWIFIRTKRDRDMNWIIGKIESYGLASDADLKRAVIRKTRQQVFVIRSNSIKYMFGLCPYLKNLIVTRPAFKLKHYIY